LEIRHIKNMSQMDCIEAYPMTISRIEDKLVLCGWCVRKWFEKDGTSGITTWPYEAYVVEKKRIIRLNAYMKCMSTVSLLGEWQQRVKFNDIWGKADLIYPWDKKLLIGSTAENSKLDMYMRDPRARNKARPVTYLRLWQKHPNLENLIMQGASALVAEMIDEEIDRYSYMYPPQRGLPFLKINWKEERPAQMLGLTKDEFRMCTQNHWDCDRLHFWKEEKEKGRILTPEEIEMCNTLGLHFCRRAQERFGLDYLKIGRYLQKQNKRDSRCDVSILEDYWRMSKEAEQDLTLPAVRFPPRLMSAHDRARDILAWRREAQEKAEKEARAKLFAERFATLSRYTWEQGEIIIRPAQSEAELINEGNKLNHCVATYARKHAQGKGAIFFIRRKKSPSKPWYTLELDEKEWKVLQNRGKNNCARTEEIQVFEDAWIGWVREQQQKKSRVKVEVQIA